jgi:trans-2,3-dihydro-3-hydroxyanthranilate isomerase
VTYAYTLLDVFTSTPLQGNALAVVHDADGLDDRAMHAFARETRLSETTFVQTADADGADYRNRIWMVSGEIPFAGHPSLGTAVAVARARGEERASYRQQTGAGVQAVDVERAGDAWRASMLQEPAGFGEELDPARVLAAVGLQPDAAHPDFPPQYVSTGAPQLLLPLRDESLLVRLEPDYAAIEALTAPVNAITFFVFWPDLDTGMVRARSWFASRGSTGEDPATGSAAGPLCAYLAQRAGRDEVVITQGVEMGRPSLLEARIEGDRPRVGGAVVPVIDGTLAL